MIVFGVILFIFLFYFRTPTFYYFSYATNFVFRPVLILQNNIGGKISQWFSIFSSKNSLISEIENLKLEQAQNEARMANYDTVLSENEKLKEVLGRKDENTPLILASILAKPNQSSYDTILIDAGGEQAISVGARVFALGNIPIGHVDTVFPNSSKVILFSNSKERTSVTLQGSLFDLVGRGGGNFELTLPRDFVLEKGAQITLPGITPHLVALVVKIISDPRDSFKKALLVSPVNIEELEFVQVEMK